MAKSGNKFNSIKRIVKHIGIVKLLLLLGVLGVFVTGVSIKVTSQPGFCNSCHIMDNYYESWEKSAHSEVSCLSCHIKPGFGHYMKGKIDGLSQAIDYAVGRVGTKPSAHISNDSCLRSGCHSVEELSKDIVDFNGVKFTHAKHIDMVADGIAVNCGTCHSHYKGNEHFSVSPETCYSCHFIKSKKTNHELADTECLDCHDVPDKVIERGAVKINHKEFVAYEASCENSCHKGQIEMESNVTDFQCLTCHDYGNEKGLSSKKLHELHSHGKKVECYACHGQVHHGPTETHSVASMASCENCHSDTHSIQQSIFGAEHHPTSSDDNKVLSPMFLTHVECSDCHIQKVKTSSKAVDSFGTVAKAVPEACDRCHEEGTGERYVPFWQKQIKGIYGRLDKKLKERTALLDQSENDPEADKKREKLEQVRGILDSVEADGSWGVHNLKYTEAILLKAKELLSELEQDE